VTGAILSRPTRIWRASLTLLAAALFPLGPEAGDAPMILARLQVYQLATPVDPPRPAAARNDGEHAARRALSGVNFHDPSNPDLRYLQRYEDAVAHLPHDDNGFPDWMRALREGSIAPRSSLVDKDAEDVLDLDIVMRNTKEMPWVRFPHRAHTLWLACGNCHPQPFEPRAGATKIQMADIFRGQYCGMCHDRVAFVTFFSCARCHSVQPTAATP
jgi:c(7)-type cytochrome triheme protein